MRPRRLKLVTQVENGWIYCVYRNHAAALIHPLFFHFSFCPVFKHQKFSSHFSQELWGPRRLKLGTHLESGQMYCVYRNQAAAAYLFIYFFHFSFSPVFKHWNFSSHFSQELWGLEGWNLVHTWTVGRCIVYTGIRLLLLIHPFFFICLSPQIAL